MTLYACYLNDSGDNIEIQDESLADIAHALAEAGYVGPKVQVYKANDEYVGWVTTTEWHYA